MLNLIFRGKLMDKNINIIETPSLKICESKEYNFIFNKKNGLFARWGITQNDDPQIAPSSEILDIEISSGSDCKGKCKKCYKGNGIEGDPTYNMTFDEFKIIFDKMHKYRLLCQIAFGILNIETNPDFFKMLKYTRQNGVIPNYTCHGLDMTEKFANETAKLCGAVAVSIVDKEKTYDTVKMLTDRNMKQINLHYVISQESYDDAFNIINDIVSDHRLKKLNAIVFLQYKHKNKTSPYHSLMDIEKYRKLINYCEKMNINYGMDSCSCNIYKEIIKNKPNKKQLEICIDPCESNIFSSYINCKGIGYPCSFAENIEEGIDILNCDDFVKDVWNNDISIKWREKLLNNNRNCPIYDLTSVGT